MKWIIDAHAHLDDEQFDSDRDELIARLPMEGVLAVINPGCDLETSEKAVSIAKKNDNVFACVGTHPHEAKYYTKETEEKYIEFAEEKKVVAIGEIGLDYHYDFSPRNVQRDVFEKQLDLAKRLNMPAVIHTREAVEDTLAIMRNFGNSISADMHSFSEEEEWLEKFIDFGYYVSLGGMITFKNAANSKRLAECVPENRIMLETDSPYLAPVPKRGRRNDPSLLKYIIEKMAEIRNCDVDILARNIYNNTCEFYSIEKEITELSVKYKNLKVKL